VQYEIGENCRTRSFIICTHGEGEKKNAYGVEGNPEGRRSLRICKHRWKDNINMNFRQIVWCGMDWIHLAQDRDQSAALVNSVMNLGFHQILGEFFNS
jgi:hypothetical protein